MLLVTVATDLTRLIRIQRNGPISEGRDVMLPHGRVLPNQAKGRPVSIVWRQPFTRIITG